MSDRPAQAIRRWPRDHPLVAIIASEPGGWSRWTILAQPVATCRGWIGADGSVRIDWSGPRALEAGASGDPSALLDRLWASGARPARAVDQIPFAGGWIGSLGYELGGVIEPTARHRAKPVLAPGRPADWPLFEWHRCPGAYVHDSRSGRWWSVGRSDALPRLGPISSAGFHAGPLSSVSGRDAHEAAVARAIEYTHAGDVFQVNLTHRLTGPFRGSTRALAAAWMDRVRPRHGAYIESGGAPGARRAIVSMSPELFLEFDPISRRVVTRPMKGTRPGCADPGDLLASAKDRAELNMIIDLMRNDLGRVCSIGSIRVEHPRTIERHAGRGDGSLWQTVATVAGRLDPRRSLGDLLRASFPPGSVTGAPKIRAMQIIDELEPVPRGPYCGAIGFVSDSGHARFNVAIRTAMVSGDAGPGGLDDVATGRLDLPVGGGVVADSSPGSEWRESLDKARAIRSLGIEIEP